MQGIVLKNSKEVCDMFSDNAIEAEFSELKGKTIVDIDGLHKSSAMVKIVCKDGTEYRMHHYQYCCECVEVEDVVGDVDWLLNDEILVSEVRSNQSDDEWGSETWTFYELATIKGSVTIRWHGSSNGYYSEDVDFERVTN